LRFRREENTPFFLLALPPLLAFARPFRCKKDSFIAILFATRLM
jgi:hypothetical protein